MQLDVARSDMSTVRLLCIAGDVEQEALDHPALVAERDHELREAVMCVVAHDVPEDRLAADLDHRLRNEPGLLGDARSETAGEDDGLHGRRRSRPGGRTAVPVEASRPAALRSLSRRGWQHHCVVVATMFMFTFPPEDSPRASSYGWHDTKSSERFGRPRIFVRAVEQHASQTCRSVGQRIEVLAGLDPARQSLKRRRLARPGCPMSRSSKADGLDADATDQS